MTWPDNRWLKTKDVSGDAYDRRYDELAAAGKDVHGEATFVMRFRPAAVLDAGCGTGRVARELARRCVDVVGVDLDADMLATARRRSPELAWVQADLASFDLARTFDVVVAAGNVMILLTPGTERAVLTNVARHLRRDGLLIAGFQLRPDHLTLAEYDALATAAGLELVERWSTWDREPWRADSAYAVSAHRLLVVQAAQPWIDGVPYSSDVAIAQQMGAARSATLVIAPRSVHPALINDPEKEMTDAMAAFGRSLR